MVVTLSLSVAAAAAAVAAAAAESAFTKLASRSLLSLGGVGVGVSVGLGGMLPVRALEPGATRFRLDTVTLGWAELKANWLDDSCSRLGSIPWASPRPCLLR